MKPTWNTAPDWAQYLAMDEDGVWTWYAKKPKASLSYWYSYDRELQTNEPTNDNWKTTLEPRPTTPDYNAMADAEYEQYVKDITAEELEDDNP